MRSILRLNEFAGKMQTHSLSITESAFRKLNYSQYIYLRLLLLIPLFGCFLSHSFAQSAGIFGSTSLGVNTTGAFGNSSSIFDISSSSKGLLIPRMTHAQRTSPGVALLDGAGNLPVAAQGLIVYQTDAGGFGEGFYYNNSTTTTPNWIKIASAGAANDWSLTGNAGTSFATNFIGTTDNVSLRFRTNGTEKLIVDSVGNVGIGNTSAEQKLHVSGNIAIPAANKIILGVNSVGLGEWIQNSPGTGFGIALYSGSAERMRIAPNGNVGIGTTAPGQKLTVEGTFGIIETGASPSFHTIFQGGDQTGDITYTLPTANASGVLTNDGAGSLSWTTLSGGTVTNVTGTAPISVATGTTTPVISMTLANGTTDGYLSSADWNTFNSKQSTALTNGKIWIGNASGVTAEQSVGGDATLSNTGFLTIANDAITSAKISAGTIVDEDISAGAAISRSKITNGTANNVLINGAGGELSSEAQLSLSRGGTNANLTAANGGAVYSTAAGLAITAAGTTGQVLTSNGAAAPSWSSFTEGDGIIGNEVKDATSGQGLTRSGTGTAGDPYTLGIATQGVANSMLINMPANSIKGRSNSVGVPTDISSSSDGDVLRVSSGSLSFGTITGLSFGSQAANKIIASPDGAAGVPSFRSLTSTDIPSLDASKITTGVLPLTNGGTNANLTAVNGGAVYSTATGLGITAAGTAGQVLTSNGTGAPSWTNAAAGTVTTVSGTAPISVATGTTTPVISMTQANGTTDGYLSSADWNTFNSKQSTALTNGNIWIGNGSNVAAPVSMNGDATISNTGALILANSGVSANSYGDALNVPTFTVDSKGRLTAAGNVAISGTLSGGTVNYIPKWSAANALSSTSLLYDNGTNVGVGTSAPVSRLHIAFDDVTTSSLLNVFTLDRTTSGGAAAVGIGSGVLFRAEDAGGTTEDAAQIGGILTSVTDGTEASALRFSTRAGGTALAERMRIDATGNVGIGTTTPSYPLHVQKSSAGIFAASIENTNATGHGLEIRTNSTASTIGSFEVYTGGTNKFAVKADGNVGIGTGSPSQRFSVAEKFHVDGNGNILKINNVTTSFPVAQGAANAVLTNDGSGNLSWVVPGASSSQWSRTAPYTYLANGTDNVGIGTTTPGSKLEIRGTTAEGNLGVLRISSPITATNDLNKIVFLDANGPGTKLNAQIAGFSDDFVTASSGLSFLTTSAASTTEKMRISGSGNVGIGTTSPGSLLHLETAGTAGLLLKSTGANTAELRFSEASSGPDYVAIKAPNVLTANYTLMLPDNDGNPNDLLTTDGNGVLSWAALPAGASAWTISGSSINNSISYNVGINASGAIPAAVNMLEVTQGSVAINTVGVLSSHTGAVGTGTGYALKAIKSGASLTNVAGYFSASEGTNNYAAIFEQGNVGIGTTTPKAILHVAGELGLGDGVSEMNNKPVVVWLRNATAGVINSGDLVAVAGLADNAIILTSVNGEAAAIGVATEAILSGSIGKVAVAGIVEVNICCNVTRGQHVMASATVGRATSVADPSLSPTKYTMGVWLETKPAGAGKARALLK